MDFAVAAWGEVEVEALVNGGNDGWGAVDDGMFATKHDVSGC
ncbi:hypothetical protein [Rappaport israeli]|nr:hypothetical protein [Rappaport israeli]